MKRISPDELEAAQFSKALKGYDTQAVDAMLKAAAGEITTLQGELKELRKEYQSDFRELEQFREKQWKLADALVIAQKAADEIRSSAQKEAVQAVEQGRQDAERIKGDARNELADVEQSIKERRKEREEFEAKFRRLLDECLTTLPQAPPLSESQPLHESQPLPETQPLPDSLSLLDCPLPNDSPSLAGDPPFSPDGQDVA